MTRDKDVLQKWKAITPSSPSQKLEIVMTTVTLRGILLLLV